MAVTHVQYYLVTGQFSNCDVFQSNPEGVVMFVFLIVNKPLFKTYSPEY